MSLQEGGPLELQQEPQQESLLQVAARIIQRAWRRYVCREIFSHVKEIISHYNQQDPQLILKTVNPREAELLDAAAGVFIRFRLGGITFPPNIYYKIFTSRPIADLCASSPKDYTLKCVKKKGRIMVQEDRSRWYQRMENNSWRLFCSRVVPISEPVEIGANKKTDFHYSKLQRKQDLESWKKRRKIEWMWHMYNQGRLQNNPGWRDVVSLVRDVAQEVTDTSEEKEDNEIEERELEELLIWTTTLNFEEYMQEWNCLARSPSSVLSKDLQ